MKLKLMCGSLVLQTNRNSTIRKSILRVYCVLINKLYDMEKESPKAFWDTLKEIEAADQNDYDSNSVISPMEWLSHFKSVTCVSRNIDAYTNTIICANKDNTYNNLLDFVITERELLYACSSLKNNKACSFDLISNEMIKCSVPILSSCYLKLFNTILNNGTFSDLWRKNIIKPLFKAGMADDPSNYRGIAISSCLSKLFCKILDNRSQNFFRSGEYYFPMSNWL